MESWKVGFKELADFVVSKHWDSDTNSPEIQLSEYVMQ